MGKPGDEEYASKLAREAKAWGDHLKLEDGTNWFSWTDHPLIEEHYRQRGLLDGVCWEQWVSKQFGGPAERSLDLGCGSGTKSLSIYEQGGSTYLEGQDVSSERIAEAERSRMAQGIPGSFQAVDTNAVRLPASTYDLIFSCHSFHHFYELEHIMKQVHQSLTPRGFFILEEFVGPTQFQWTDQQIDLVRSVLSLVPERLRHYQHGMLKTWEGRPTPEEVVAVSPFESIRSSEIEPLFNRYFKVVARKLLGGTLQHLLYNGIVHHFLPHDEEAVRQIHGIANLEDALIDTGMLPSDFMLLVGQRKDV